MVDIKIAEATMMQTATTAEHKKKQIMQEQRLEIAAGFHDESCGCQTRRAWRMGPGLQKASGRDGCGMSCWFSVGILRHARAALLDDVNE